MKLKDFKLSLLLIVISVSTFAQYKVSGIVIDVNRKTISNVGIYDVSKGLLTKTNTLGQYSFETSKKTFKLIFFSDSYSVSEEILSIDKDIILNKTLFSIGGQLSAVEITARQKEVFALKHLNDVEETAIFAGKKTEVVLVEASMANLATNNARQLYNQVAGLNIYETDDAGLQLSIGGRGLDPNRTTNFNTRQNGYDISADVLGYPESYYSPAAAGLKEVQIIRGAASLQYGTQFGGLINFKMKEPVKDKKVDVTSRFTRGRFNLFTNFTSLSGTINKFSYYTYYNYKSGDGFRPNSQFESKNAFGHFGYQISDRTKITADFTYMNYLAKQAGGLTDTMFEDDPLQSNRSRNWFEVNWFLYNFKLAHKFSEESNFTFNFFGLDAQRNSVGFRVNRVSIPDVLDAPRDLIIGKFRNFGFETRFLNSYSLLKKKNTFLVGAKYYKSNNVDQQGPGSSNDDPDFNFDTSQFDTYRDQSDFRFPNENISVFGENIFYVNDKLSITPGFRFEYIKTASNGEYKNISENGAGEVINVEVIQDNTERARNFVLLGLGLSYKYKPSLEVYANASQNYRSVTFSDIKIVNPSYFVDENISDEKGYTLDLGLRGNINKYVSYDAGVFGLFYNDRIGLELREDAVLIGNVLSPGVYRDNIGDAVIYGFESLIDFNLKKFIIKNNNDLSMNLFFNTSFIDSKYKNGINEGKKVEFVPNFNFKTGIKFGYKNFLSSIQYTYLSKQFTDATNVDDTNDSSGILGPIPSYDVLDFSLSYRYKMFKLETGINNLLDKNYFTRRATGYPGPGIIPSAPRNWYATLQVNF
jgi:Fe(3+) dicitrate transport protein